MENKLERSADSLNGTTKEIIKERAKSKIMSCLLSIKETDWEKDVFFENVHTWLEMAESLDKNGSLNRDPQEVLSLWSYLVETVRSLCFYPQEEIEKADRNVKEIIRTINSLSISSAGLFFFSTIIQINEQEPFKGAFSELITHLENIYKTLSIA